MKATWRRGPEPLRPDAVGILAIEVYFPAQQVSMADMEAADACPGKYTVGLGQEAMSFASDREDAVSIALTAAHCLLEKYGVRPDEVGHLQVATESGVDRSKSIKSHLMALFTQQQQQQQQQPNQQQQPQTAAGQRPPPPRPAVRGPPAEGADVTHACFGATQALLAAAAWVESRQWDGRLALVVAADVALYAPGSAARPTGGCGGAALLVGPHAPLVLDPLWHGAHGEAAWDFFKPLGRLPFPAVDGPLTLAQYLGAAGRCALRCAERLQAAGELAPGEGLLPRVSHFIGHAPFNKLVRKGLARIALMDQMRAAAVAAADGGSAGSAATATAGSEAGGAAGTAEATAAAPSGAEVGSTVGAAAAGGVACGASDARPSAQATAAAPATTAAGPSYAAPPPGGGGRGSDWAMDAAGSCCSRERPGNAEEAPCSRQHRAEQAEGQSGRCGSEPGPGQEAAGPGPAHGPGPGLRRPNGLHGGGLGARRRDARTQGQAGPEQGPQAQAGAAPGSPPLEAAEAEAWAREWAEEEQGRDSEVAQGHAEACHPDDCASVPSGPSCVPPVPVQPPSTAAPPAPSQPQPQQKQHGVSTLERSADTSGPQRCGSGPSVPVALPAPELGLLSDASRPLPESVDSYASWRLDDKALEARLLASTEATWREKAEDAAWLQKQTGNSYTASLWQGLAGLVCRHGEALAGRRLLLYSFGSGTLAALFSLVGRGTHPGRHSGDGGVDGDGSSVDDDAGPRDPRFTLAAMQRALDLERRLAARMARPVAVYDRVSEQVVQAYGCPVPYDPCGDVTDVAAGAYYLVRVDEQSRRWYERKG